jgi:hypothetical protein
MAIDSLYSLGQLGQLEATRPVLFETRVVFFSRVDIQDIKRYLESILHGTADWGRD